MMVCKYSNPKNYPPPFVLQKVYLCKTIKEKLLGTITVKQVKSWGNLILQILQKVQIHKIKLLRNCKFHIENNSKFLIFAKSSCH